MFHSNFSKSHSDSSMSHFDSSMSHSDSFMSHSDSSTSHFDSSTSHSQACRTLLKLPPLREGSGSGYDELCRSLVVLMGCGMEYDRQSHQLQDRVLVRRGVATYVVGG